MPRPSLGSAALFALLLGCSSPPDPGPAALSTEQPAAATTPAAEPAEPTPADASPPDQALVGYADAGRAAWRSVGCFACHGQQGEGGVGPQLAGAVPQFDAMRTQVRAGAPPMPAYDAASLSDQAIADVRAFLLEQPVPGAPDPNPDVIDAPLGVDVERVVAGLDYPVALAFGPDGSLFVSTNGKQFPRAGQAVGAVWRIEDGVAKPFIAGLERPLGLLWQGERLLISVRGEVQAWSAAGKELGAILADLPSDGLHQNNGLVQGPDGRLYLGMGTASNATPSKESDWNGTVLSFDADAGRTEVFARGLRNPFDLAFDAQGRLYATDNSVDPPLVRNAPEELNLVQRGGHYGHPWAWGSITRKDLAVPDGVSLQPPLVELPPHASANGLLYYDGGMFSDLQGKLITAEFGSYLAGHRQAGRRLSVITPPAPGSTTTGAATTWASGFLGRPVDLAQGPDGSIYVSDFEMGVVWRFFASDRERPRFAPGFDCSKASGLVELALCNEPGLARLDVRLNAAYKAARAQVDAEGKARIKAAQRAWLKERNACSGDAWPVECLRLSMIERIDQLEGAS